MGGAVKEGFDTTLGNLRGAGSATQANIRGAQAVTAGNRRALQEVIFGPTPELPEIPGAQQPPQLRSVQTPAGRRRRRDEEFDLFGTLLAGLPQRQGALATPATNNSAKTVLG